MKRIVTPKIGEIRDFQERGKYLMIWRITLLFVGLFTILGAMTVFSNLLLGMLYFIIVLIASGTLVYIKKTKKCTPVFWMYAVSGTILCHISLSYIPTIVHYAEFLWIVSTIIFAFITLSKKSGWFFIGVNAISIGYFVFIKLNDHIQVLPTQTISDHVATIIEILFALFVFGYLMTQYIQFETYNKIQLKKLNQNLESKNEEVLLQNKENITLLKEVHHRVKNNLQIIVSLLRMQQSEIESEETRQHFSVAINRVLTMSLIHQKLYQNKEPSKIVLNDYLQSLTDEILYAMNNNKHITLCIDSEVELLDMETVVTFGLLLNELISNTLKHAFKDRKEGKIKFELNYNEFGHIVFSYEDDGMWQEPEDYVGFGNELIDVLVDQLEGNYERFGSKYIFILKTEEVFA